MAIIGSVFVCIVLMTSKEVTAKGLFQTKVLSYINLNKTIFDGKCCSQQSSDCQYPCIICMTMEISIVSTNETHKIHRATHSVLKSFYDVKVAKEMSTTSAGSYKTGILVKFVPKKWRVRVRFYHQQDRRTCHQTNLFEEIEDEYMITATRTERHILRGHLIDLTLQSRFDCHKNWFGRRCDQFCVDGNDDVTGYYTCEEGTGRKLCLANYYGDKCTHFCAENDHFRCGRNGERIRLKNCTNTRKSCTYKEPEEICPFYSRWMEIITRDAAIAKRVWKTLKNMICSTVNKNCFGREVCPKTSNNDLLALKEILIYNASVEENDITLRMEIRGKDRCVHLKDTCLNMDRLPSIDGVETIITYQEIAIEPHSNTRMAENRNRMIFFSLLGLFVLVIFMIILDRILKPKEIVNMAREILTPNVIKRTRM